MVEEEEEMVEEEEEMVEEEENIQMYTCVFTLIHEKNKPLQWNIS